MKRRGRLIERYTEHYLDTEVELRLTRGMVFEAHIGDIVVTSTDASKIKSLVSEKIKSIMAVEWTSIIQVEFDEEEHFPSDAERLRQSAQFKLGYNRLYYAKIKEIDEGHYKGQTLYRQLSWSRYHQLVEDGAESWRFVAEAKRFFGEYKDSTKEHVVSTGHEVNGEGVEEDISYVNGTFYRPYSEELWQGLGKLRDVINQANSKISELVSTDAGLNILMSGNIFALTEGKRTP